MHLRSFFTSLFEWISEQTLSSFTLKKSCYENMKPRTEMGRVRIPVFQAASSRRALFNAHLNFHEYYYLYSSLNYVRGEAASPYTLY